MNSYFFFLHTYFKVYCKVRKYPLKYNLHFFHLVNQFLTADTTIQFSQKTNFAHENIRKIPSKFCSKVGYIHTSTKQKKFSLSALTAQTGIYNLEFKIAHEFGNISISVLFISVLMLRRLRRACNELGILDHAALRTHRIK